MARNPWHADEPRITYLHEYACRKPFSGDASGSRNVLAMTISRGLRALVTAGASGIGWSIASALHAAGATVHICDVSSNAIDTARQTIPEITATLTDVTDVDQVDKLFADVRTHLGGLDVLVNNAGIAGPTAAVEDIAPDEWRRTLDVNITGQFLCARRAVPLLKQNGEGVIINMSSVAGRLGYAMRTPYAASKWAIVGFTQSLAIELGSSGIRVNAILPGIVEGPRIERVIRDRASAQGVTYDEMEERYLDQISLRRMVSAGDVAETVLFLCSAGGRNISGQSLSVCGNVEFLR
jgi:NAD(P)-dependent dehydrogenase (short-subunit alcohol dehydrogenase family)